MREFDRTIVDSSADEQAPTQVESEWSDGSSTDTVREGEPRIRWESRAVFGGRRVVLVPASPGSTPRSVQDMQPSVGSNRFAVLAHDDVDIVTEEPPAPVSSSSGVRIARPSRARPIQRTTRRRLVLRGVTERTDVVQVPPDPHVEFSAVAGLDDLPSDADLDDDERVAIPEGGEVEALEELPELADPIPFDLPRRNLRAGFNVLDGVSLPEVFARRAVVMRNIPKCFRGAYVAAARVSTHEILDGKASGNMEREVCGWKLFFLLPRLLLFRPLRGGLVSNRKLQERMALLNAGDWTKLLLESNSIAEAGVQDDVSRRAARAERLALLGELSAGRQALEGAAIAPGNLSTLRALKKPVRRPATPREPLHDELTNHVPEREFQLDPDVFLANVRSARRGEQGHRA